MPKLPKLIDPPIDPEEADLFRKSVGVIKPLKQDKYLVRTKKDILTPPSNPKKPAFHWESSFEPSNWLSAEDEVHFAKTGLQHKVIQRLKQGRMPIEAKLDLHRHTVNKAIDTVSHFIHDCLQHQRRWILIIHGKGNFSPEGKPILKNFLNEWLRGEPNVLAFHSASTKLGGRGALIVLLKRNLYEK